ncbi:MAG: leucine-rich repeat domain-containing protein [Eubacteriales bacterium]
MKALKLIILTLITVMLLSPAVSLYAYGETENGVVVDNVTTGETDDEGKPYLTVLGYRGYKSTVDIPSVVDGQTVKYISKSAFSANQRITKVIIPDTVVDIGDEVFTGCINLRTVILPKNLTKVNISAFSGCTLLDAIILPDTLAVIDDFAFEYCSMLKTVKIPASVTQIGYYTFMSCENLILDCSENDYALTYAAENNIVTNTDESPDSPLKTAIIITIILGVFAVALNFTVKFIRRKNKNQQKKTADNSAET